MKNLTQKLMLVVISAMVLSACNPMEEWPINFNEGAFPDSVTNFTAVNTRFDDYNSAGPPSISFSMPLVFSSNRDSDGDNFNLIEYQLYVRFNQTDGTLYLGAERYQTYPFYHLTNLSNSNKDEFGPYTSHLGGDEYFFFFSSNRTGNMEIYVSYFTPYSFSGIGPVDPDPFRMISINSPRYDAYATLSVQHDQLLLSSERDGNLDIYRAIPPKPYDFYSWARSDTAYPVEKVDILNSPAEDLCPYINGNLLVFASKREGGFGGYDLYYSKHDGNEWQTPVNFGPKINSEYDEFRPVVFYAPYFTNELLIFSSNRPGGSGGYDLYYVGIEKMIE